MNFMSLSRTAEFGQSFLQTKYEGIILDGLKSPQVNQSLMFFSD